MTQIQFDLGATKQRASDEHAAKCFERIKAMLRCHVCGEAYRKGEENTRCRSCEDYHASKPWGAW